jgi:hypothetical protein
LGDLSSCQGHLFLFSGSFNTSFEFGKTLQLPYSKRPPKYGYLTNVFIKQRNDGLLKKSDAEIIGCL